MDTGSKKKVSHVRTEQFSPPLHARSILQWQSVKKKVSELHGYEKAIEKKSCERRKRDEICVIDHRWCFFMVLCRNSMQKKCDLHFSECHSLWINCIIINTRGQVDFIAVVVWNFCDFYRLVGSMVKHFYWKILKFILKKISIILKLLKYQKIIFHLKEQSSKIFLNFQLK